MGGVCWQDGGIGFGTLGKDTGIAEFDPHGKLRQAPHAHASFFPAHVITARQEI